MKLFNFNTNVCLAIVVLLLAGTTKAVEIETVSVGNPGNAGELSSPSSAGAYEPCAPDRVCGAVDYLYKIGKYEVTNAQYCEFLNSVASNSDPHGLYNPNMGIVGEEGYGIERIWNVDHYDYYTITGRANKPVKWVSFWDACRFANWLHNGQGSSDTEIGAYTLTSGGMANNTITRYVGWKWAITSEDEWYKAAYHKNDGVTGNYWDYPTGSDIPPTAEAPPGTDMINGSANYDGSGGPEETDVGAYWAKPSSSPYGTFDQGGNAWEWNETVWTWEGNAVRGGEASSNVGEDAPGISALHAMLRGLALTAEGFNDVGFRVVENPQPINPGDADRNGYVDFVDFSLLANQWLDGPEPPAQWEDGDFYDDNIVDIKDLSLLASYWLEGSEISYHVFQIEISIAWDYEGPNDSNDMEYGFELWLGTDDRVESIKFLAPSGHKYEIPKIQWQEFNIPGGYTETEWEYDSEKGMYGWSYYTAFNEPNGLSSFGDGDYIITVYYDNGRQDQTTVWFGIPETPDPIPQPIQEPNFISFEQGDNLTSPVTIEWESCTDPTPNHILVSLDNENTGEEYDYIFSVDVNGFEEPLTMSEGLWEAELGFEVWYQFQNNDGINVWLAKYSESDYIFTIVP
jgi:sulfatase modifying factor 1